MTKKTKTELIEECRQAAIKAAGGEVVRASDGDVIFDAEDWEPTARDMEWVEAELAK